MKTSDLTMVAVISLAFSLAAVLWQCYSSDDIIPLIWWAVGAVAGASATVLVVINRILKLDSQDA